MYLLDWQLLHIHQVKKLQEHNLHILNLLPFDIQFVLKLQQHQYIEHIF